MLPLLLAFSLACRPGAPNPDGDGDVVIDDSGSGGSGGEESGGEEGGDDDDDDVEVLPSGDHTRSRECKGLYDPEALNQFELELSSTEWAALEADFAGGVKRYHPATFTWVTDEGRETVDAQVRLKGNPNFSWFGDKLQFVISFNEDDNDARFHGVRKVALDASWYEPTHLRDRLSWSILREVNGLPAACANSARLDINGSYYGLYTSIEYFDHEWLEETFGDEYADGTLWKYGSEAKTNEDEADSALVNKFFYATTVPKLEELGDMEQWLTAWAAEAVLGDDDGYWCCEHNFYIYEHPTRDLVMVPWDLDDLFDVTPYDMDPIHGYSNPYGLFRQVPFLALATDDTWGPVYVDAVETVAEALDPAVLVPRVEAWAAQIEDSVLEDPHRSIGYEEHEESIPRLTDYLVSRRAFLDSWVACQRGETTDADEDGYTVCEDTDDNDASINPGATETCNGRDDDSDGRVDELASCEDCARHDSGDGHFLFCRNERTWAAAQANCEAHGGNLGFPTNTPEYYLFYWYTWPVYEGWWLGATDAASEGTWVDPEGSSVSTWAYWGSGQPNGSTTENCAAWHPNYSGWVDLKCGDKQPSVCRL